jgi:acetolactate synthase-1/2/3 large subunit
MSEKYGEHFIDWLVESGYSTCFFVAGGNTMHLLAAARSRMKCIPVVHEVTAAIAAEYFNEHSRTERAFALVTAGPGLTNAITGIAGAWLESRELLVVGGQVKSSDLASPSMRQRGIQEIKGVELVSSITKASVLIDKALEKRKIQSLCELSRQPRKGPVFLEMCLDVQGAPYEPPSNSSTAPEMHLLTATDEQVLELSKRIASAKKPVLLLGGGLDRASTWALRNQLNALQVPIMTSWNGADRFASDNEMWFGRPDTWGMRYSNLLIQQADLVVAFGARLSMQQTGFNWQEFVPNGQVVQVDIDESETSKGHPHVDLVLNVDADDLLRRIAEKTHGNCSDWIAHCRYVEKELPLDDPLNETSAGFISPYQFVQQLSTICDSDTSVVPCSSGGANTVMMQSFLNKTGQVFFNNKALASMGYGLAGAIGASLANRSIRTVLVEGDGGFSQNSQDLATLVAQNLNIKIFIFSNRGYASIRMTQRNYFGGDYVGCDVETGLGFPDWQKLADSYGLRYSRVTTENLDTLNQEDAWLQPGPVLYLIDTDPEQTYYPKIASRVAANGGMESAPIHSMTPELSPEMLEKLYHRN